MDYIIVSAIAYLIGSIPFGYILVRLFKKQDIRTTGSGNIGATNVARTAPGLGIVTLLLDVLKGFLPTFLSGAYAYHHSHVAYPAALIGLAALFAVLGHVFPLWLGFRGGKGVATAAGAFLMICPQAVGLSLLVFLIVLAVTRYVSLGSIVGTACFPLFAWYFERAAPWDTRLLLGSSLIIAVLIILKHHENIRRLISGTENKFSRKKKAEAVIAED